MNAKPLSFYAKAIRPQLSKDAFDAVPSRLAWLALHWTIIVAGTLALIRGLGGLWAAPLWSLLIGHSFAGSAFVGHETMHGAVVRNKIVRHLVGWLCFLPLLLSPRLWVAWHNKVHHGNTMIDGVDPDGRSFNEQNLFATLFTALGIDPHGEFDLPGFPTFHRVEDNAEPIAELLA